MYEHPSRERTHLAVTHHWWWRNEAGCITANYSQTAMRRRCKTHVGVVPLGPLPSLLIITILVTRTFGSRVLHTRILGKNQK
jgi:hypothetical protein